MLEWFFSQDQLTKRFWVHPDVHNLTHPISQYSYMIHNTYYIIKYDIVIWYYYILIQCLILYFKCVFRNVSWSVFLRPMISIPHEHQIWGRFWFGGSSFLFVIYVLIKKKLILIYFILFFILLFIFYTFIYLFNYKILMSKLIMWGKKSLKLLLTLLFIMFSFCQSWEEGMHFDL